MEKSGRLEAETKGRKKTIAANLAQMGLQIELSVSEIAVYLGLDHRTIYDLVANNQIPVRKIKLPSRKKPLLRFNVADINAWRDQHSQHSLNVR